MPVEKRGFLFRLVIKISIASIYMDIHGAEPNIKPLRVDTLRLLWNFAASRWSSQDDPAILDSKHAVLDNAMLQYKFCVCDVLHTAFFAQSRRSISRYRR